MATKRVKKSPVSLGIRKGKLSEANHALIVKLMNEQVPIYLIARKLGVERHTLSNYIRAHEELAQASKDAEESFNDSVEYLFKQRIIKDRDLHAAQWYADRKLRSRGYGEHIDTDQNINNSGRVILNIGRIPQSEMPEGKQS